MKIFKNIYWIGIVFRGLYQIMNKAGGSHSADNKQLSRLNQMLKEEKDAFGQFWVYKFLDSFIISLWNDEDLEVDCFPVRSSDIPDDPFNRHLVILHYENQAVDPCCIKHSDLIDDIYNFRDRNHERQHKDNLIFLAADCSRVQRMVKKTERYLSIRMVEEDEDLYNSLTEIQKIRFQKEKYESEMILHIAVNRAYRFIFYPSNRDLKLRYKTIDERLYGWMSNSLIIKHVLDL